MARFVETIYFFVALVASICAQDADVNFDITEELPINSPVGNVPDVINLFSDLTIEQRQSLQFGILSQSSLPASLFNITVTGGYIYVAKRIDREELCYKDPDCTLKINILASPQVPSDFDSRVVTVHFRLLDINDNDPMFKSENVVLEVPERNSVVDSVLKISGATDADYKPEFQVKNYTLSDFRDVFQLSTSETLDGSSEIDLKLLKSLDRETKDQYDFVITAYDGGVPPRSKHLAVTVHVTDKNDHNPVFENASYSVTIDSNTPVSTVILRVSATDEDIGDNAQLTYDFSSIQKPLLDGIFEINTTSGEISVSGPLQSGVSGFIVEAQDAGNPRLKTQTQVTVTVISTGNVAPQVSITTITTGQDKNYVTVTEPGGRNLFLAFVVVSDDSDDPVTCEISSSADVFRMDPIPGKGYQIVLQGTVDREARDSYNLTVVCVDKGDPPMNGSATVTVKVKDANDNVPEFGQATYKRTLKEGRKDGEFVLQVDATDKDIDQNGEIVYSIDPNFMSYFRINPDNGVLTAIGLLDREARESLQFKVFATDRGDPPNQGSADVIITLEDVNDNMPEFAKNVFTILTPEEVEGQHRIIGQLTATDADSGPNGQLEYIYGTSLDGSEGYFKVLRNGSIETSAKLNREDKTNYSFSVMVKDSGTPKLMARASVVVEVLDVNDNSPQVLFPRTLNHTVLISSVPETGVVLSRIIAYDDDAGDNGSLKYTIVSGNEDRAFEIDENSGEFRIADGDRLKNYRQYNVGIVIEDRGLPPRHNTTAIRVDVQYNNITLGVFRSDESKQEDYIIIVAVVAAVTVIFSTIIIVAICVVFQKDRNSRRKAVSGSGGGGGGSGHGSLASLKTTGFTNLKTPENLSDDEKVIGTTREKSRYESSYGNQYPVNNLSSPTDNNFQFPSAPPVSEDDEKALFQMKPSYHEHNQKQQNLVMPSSGRSKAVSFSLDNDRDDLPPALSTFASPRSDDAHLGRSHVSRQGDDVTSDTSGDTTTSDSGRGNSVDDVTFEQIMKGELSPQLTPRRPSDDLHLPPRKPRSSEANPARASYHVRFSQQQNPQKSLPALPPKHSVTRPQFDGGRLLSSSRHGGTFVNQNDRPSYLDIKNKHGPSHRPVPNPGSNNSNNIHPISATTTSSGHTRLATSSSSNSINNSSDCKRDNPAPKIHKNMSATLSAGRQLSIASIDDDATTTTSGSYVINPEDVRMETFVGSDIIV